MSEPRAKVNVPIVVASLTISVVLWAAVYSQNAPYSTRQVEIDLVRDGLDTTRYAVVDGPRNDKLRLWVTGSEIQVEELLGSERFGLVDLSNPVLGKRAYPVALQPNLLREVASNPNPEVMYEIQAIERKAIKVQIDSTDALNTPGLRLDQLIVEPPEAVISGATSRVAQVASVRGTFSLSKVDPEQRTPFQVQLIPYNREGRPLDNVKVEPLFASVTPVLTPSPQEKTAFVFARFTGTPAPGFESTGYRVDPQQVTLVGPSFTLAGITRVETEPIDQSGLEEGKTVTVAIRVPSGVTQVRPARVKVTLMIQRKSGTSSGTSQPPATNGGVPSVGGNPE